MEYQVVLEHDADSGHVTATVPSIPGIIVDASSEEDALAMVREAIGFWREENAAMQPEHVSAKLATVEA